MTGGFHNPIIGGFHPDPSVCRVGDDFYLVTSTFEYFPGVPIFHSRDLVHWRQLGNVLDRPEQLPLETAPSSGGIFAPTIRHHDGRFFMITTNFWGGGNFFVTAEDPAGPWSDPVRLEVPGIDPDLAWDDEGGCLVTTSGIAQCRVDDVTGERLSEPQKLWSGTGLQFPEAPHLYRRGDWWYLLLAEGGTERGHAVSIARSRSPEGPFEGCPHNPVLSHRSTDRPIQSTGHADLVELADGRWWMVLLATRPRGMTPMYHVLGRETFLVPVRWTDDGWPVVDPVELDHDASPLAAHPWPAGAERDDFDGEELHSRWISVRRRRPEDWSLSERPGWLTLHGGADDLDGPLPVFVGRRQQHLRATATTRVTVEAGARAGLAVRIDERHHLDVAVSGGRAVVSLRVGDLTQELASVEVGAEAELAIEAHDPVADFGVGPDALRVLVDGAELADLDGRYLSTEVASGFTGRVIGMFAVDGVAHFDWFDYTGMDPAEQHPEDQGPQEAP